MKKRFYIPCIIALCTILQAFLFISDTKVPPYEAFAADTLASGLSVPWDMVFLPGSGNMIFTERPGRVQLFRNNLLVQKPVLTIADIKVRGKMADYILKSAR